MKKLILVAGATGNLGGRIVKALLKKGADVKVIVRPSTDASKIKAFEDEGVSVIKVEMTDHDGLTQAASGASCIVSALQGLEDVIVDAQTILLHAAIAAGVHRFIPSDYSIDFTDLPDGENRNFDLRRKFHAVLAGADIKATSVFNGAFTDILAYNTPLLDLKKNSIGYWEDADWPIDFTTMDNTAEFTAEAALDETSPAKLHIASFRITPNELKERAEKIMGRNFSLKLMGSREDFKNQIQEMRKANPEGENELYPQWQQMQYLLSMFSASYVNLDNDRYADIHWTPATTILSSMS